MAGKTVDFTFLNDSKSEFTLKIKIGDFIAHKIIWRNEEQSSGILKSVIELNALDRMELAKQFYNELSYKYYSDRYHIDEMKMNLILIAQYIDTRIPVAYWKYKYRTGTCFTNIKNIPDMIYVYGYNYGDRETARKSMTKPRISSSSIKKKPSEKQLYFIDSLSKKNKIELDNKTVKTMYDASLIIECLYKGNKSIDISPYLLNKKANKKNLTKKIKTDSCIKKKSTKKSQQNLTKYDKDKIVICDKVNNEIKPRCDCDSLCETHGSKCKYLGERECLKSNNNYIYLVYCTNQEI